MENRGTTTIGGPRNFRAALVYTPYSEEFSNIKSAFFILQYD